MATDPLRMANGTVLFIPPNGANIIQAGQIIPGTVFQTSGILQYPGLQPGSPNNLPEPNHQVGLREKLYKAETKTLGAIQIIIGMIHIGFGGVSVVIHRMAYVPFATVAGYPFWGGLFFIVSGSLSVAAEKHQDICLVKRSVGMNITSAVMAAFGVVLYITDLAINPLYYYFSYDSTFLRSAGLGLSVMLLLFSVLEFCITVWTTYSGCQATSSSSDMTMMMVPYSVSAGGVMPAEDTPAPPPYDYVVSAQKHSKCWWGENFP
ncbi:membrane-spanning 4-domains subfamily A member 15-like isoform X1 [Eublepharis macularius]|uniref:Membrane-spanning 4-domains subfamily A member 15-like isoform X1 n=1 Tax=Eublepharis macularius TaxID=481883 RepID=A0AA97IYL1_EUBMA|nr:membrane-spanning 4-domains subfamily A member 15-like isoform X1 [Eublepharis macularius]